MSPLLAQANNGPPDEVVFAIIGVVCVFVLIGLIIQIFYLLTLSKALSRCTPRNRTMEPGMVWLNLIPLFSLVWMFITVIRVSESLQNEFRSRGWHRRGEEYGKGLGIAYCALEVAGIIPYIGSCFALAGLICWIIYWIKIAGFSSQIATRGYDNDYEDDYYEDDYDEDDDRDDDDRRRRRKRRDDYDDDYDDRR